MDWSQYELVVLAVSVLLLFVIPFVTLLSVSLHRWFASEDRMNCPRIAADTASVLEMSKCQLMGFE